MSLKIFLRCDREINGPLCYTPQPNSMDIRVVSSLSADDEDQLAPAVLTTLAALLAALPVAYALRLETTNGKVMQRTSLPPGDPPLPVGLEHLRHDRVSPEP